MIREVIEDTASASCPVAAGNALAIEKYILGFQGTGKIAFSHYAGCHVPVKCSSRTVRFDDAVSISVIRIGVAVGSSDAVFRVKSVCQAAGQVMSHVSSGIISVTHQLIIGCGCENKILC